MTRFRRGFFFRALALAFRVLAARIAPAFFMGIPDVAAILAWTAANPGCVFMTQ